MKLIPTGEMTLGPFFPREFAQGADDLSVSGGCGGEAGSGLPAPRSSRRTDSWSVSSTATLAPASRIARWVATASGSLLPSARAFSRPYPVNAKESTRAPLLS